MQTLLAIAWVGLFPGAQPLPEATEVGNRILKHLDICKFTLIHLCISTGWQMCVIHGVMFFRRLHLLDAPGCLDSIGTYSLSMFYLHNKVMNDRAATARRVGSKDCNLSWVSCKSEKGMRVRDWESDHVQKSYRREAPLCRIPGCVTEVLCFGIQSTRIHVSCVWMLPGEP